MHIFFTWAGQAVKLLNEFGQRMKYDVIDPIEVKYTMQGDDDYNRFYSLGREVALKSKN